MKQRWCEHKSDAKFKNYHLYKSMNKYGIENFNIYEIDRVESKILLEFNENLNALERYYIELYNTFDKNVGYNETTGGEGVCGYKQSEEQIELIRKRVRGRVVSEETKKKISDYWKANVNPMLGCHLSEDAKRKISEANKGRLCGEKNPMWGKKRQDLSERNKKDSIKVCQIDKETGEVLKIWDSMRECSRETGFNRSCIADCCYGKTSQSHGYIWMFYNIGEINVSA